MYTPHWNRHFCEIKRVSTIKQTRNWGERGRNRRMNENAVSGKGQSTTKRNSRSENRERTDTGGHGFVRILLKVWGSAMTLIIGWFSCFRETKIKQEIPQLPEWKNVQKRREVTNIWTILAETQVEKLSPVDIFIFRNNDFLSKLSLRNFSNWCFISIGCWENILHWHIWSKH